MILKSNMVVYRGKITWSVIVEILIDLTVHKSLTVFKDGYKQQTSILLICYNKTLFLTIGEPREEQPGLTAGVKTEFHNSHNWTVV